VGRVGAAVVDLARRERDRLEGAGVRIEWVGGLVRDAARDRGTAGALFLTSDPRRLFAAAPDLVIEALGGDQPAAGIVSQALTLGISVVTANKTLVARHGVVLERLARRHGATLAYEAAVVAGVPFVGALQRRPLAARATGFEGIVNGTSNVVLTAITRGATFDAALAEAVASGYAEPDASADLSGRDAAEKLVILLRLAGLDARADAIAGADVRDITGVTAALARALGGVIKPVAVSDWSREPSAWAGPAFVHRGHPLAAIDGVTNALSVQDVDGRRVTFAGPGAGPEVTAATILDDVVEAAASRHQAPRPLATLASLAPEAPSGSWFLAVEGLPAEARDLVDHVATRGLVVRRTESIAGAHALVSWPAHPVTIGGIVGGLRAIGARAIALPVLEGGDRG
jgi:homoserine dehydrogenase